MGWGRGTVVQLGGNGAGVATRVLLHGLVVGGVLPGSFAITLYWYFKHGVNPESVYEVDGPT